jgi:hypothetical protein
MMRAFIEWHCRKAPSEAKARASDLRYVGGILFAGGTLEVFATTGTPILYTLYWRETGKIHRSGLTFVDALMSIQAFRDMLRTQLPGHE